MPIRKSDPRTAPGQLALQFELPFLSLPPPSAGPSERRRLIHLGERVLEYGLRRSRRRSIGFVIDDEGLTVTAPRWVTLAQIDAAVREKERWILAKLAEMRERHRAIPRVRWEDGGTVPYLGAPVTLSIKARSGGRDAVLFCSAERVLSLSLPPNAAAQQIKDRVQGWLQLEARRIFAERLEVFAARLGVRHRAFRLSSAATRWGSCSADGRILLNWRLVHFPQSSIDYVVAHELSHLKEMNHGPRFWKTVESIFPDFEAVRTHLKDPPHELLPLL